MREDIQCVICGLHDENFGSGGHRSSFCRVVRVHLPVRGSQVRFLLGGEDGEPTT